MYTLMALSVKPYFFPALWMMMAGLVLLMAGDRSRLGEESRDDGLDDSEWGDIGLANGEAPWWSENRQRSRQVRSNKSADQSHGRAEPCRTDPQGSSATAWWRTPT